MSGKSLRESEVVVGVTSRSSAAAWRARWTANYENRLLERGATPVILAPDAPVVLPSGARYEPDAEGRLPVEILEHLDGIVFAGGGDVHPRYFGQEVAGVDVESIDLRRDELELALGRAALARDLPVFGVCRGCQVLNVAAGGAMVQHIEGHRSDTEAPRLHNVVVRSDSRLGAIAGDGTLAVNTYHHQALDRNTLATCFLPAAFDGSQGWVIEAYESPVHRWLLGVQWHPERAQDFAGETARRQEQLWNSFVDACGERRGQGTQQGFHSRCANERNRPALRRTDLR